MAWWYLWLPSARVNLSGSKACRCLQCGAAHRPVYTTQECARQSPRYQPIVYLAMLLQTLLLTLCACAPPLRPGVEAQRIPDPAKRSLYRLEKIDVDTMLRNDRIMTSYVRCFIGKGACSPEARDFRSKSFSTYIDRVEFVSLSTFTMNILLPFGGLIIITPCKIVCIYLKFNLNSIQ